MIHCDGVKRMIDGRGRRALGTDLDSLGIPETPRREAADFLGNRSGKKQGLALLGTGLDNPAHIGKEAHVQHAINLIENQEVELR